MRKRDVALLSILGVAFAGAAAGLWVKRQTKHTPVALPRLPSAIPSGEVESSRCNDRSSLELDFAFLDNEAPWQRDRRYQLELRADHATFVCGFEVPQQHSYGTQGHCDFDRTPSWDSATASIAIRGKPVRVEARVLSDGVVFYRGAVSPRYEREADDCSYVARLELVSEKGGD